MTHDWAAIPKFRRCIDTHWNFVALDYFHKHLFSDNKKAIVFFYTKANVPTTHPPLFHAEFVQASKGLRLTPVTSTWMLPNGFCIAHNYSRTRDQYTMLGSKSAKSMDPESTGFMK